MTKIKATKLSDIPERVSKSFWPRVQKTDDCWIWTGNKNSHGYGLIEWFNGVKRKGGVRNSVLAHRYSYVLHKEDILENVCVCHACDNRFCVNPDHLWIGKHIENMIDCSKKLRFWNSAQLDVISKVRQLHTNGLERKEIAKQLGISYYIVGGIISKRFYKYVTTPADPNHAAALRAAVERIANEK